MVINQVGRKKAACPSVFGLAWMQEALSKAPCSLNGAFARPQPTWAQTGAGGS